MSRYNRRLLATDKSQPYGQADRQTGRQIKSNISVHVHPNYKRNGGEDEGRTGEGTTTTITSELNLANEAWWMIWGILY